MIVVSPCHPATPEPIAVRRRRRTVTIKQQVQQWFDWVDAILAIHRSNFVFRDATPAELAQHKTVMAQAIRACLVISNHVLDPDFNEPNLASRLQIRIQRLKDAYNTFHAPALSAEEAEKILERVFPG